MGLSTPRSRMPPLHPPVLPTDESYWKALPDILQAQLHVALDSYNRKRGNKPAEQLLWAGAPHLRTRSMLFLFALWSVLLIVPVFVLVEMVEDIGGWLALGWAVVSVFLFVPRISRNSRVAFALTTSRAFISERTMFCSITTTVLPHVDVMSCKMSLNSDQTGTIQLRGVPSRFAETRIVTFDHVLQLRDCCRVLDVVLPPEIVEDAGLSRSDSKK